MKKVLGDAFFQYFLFPRGHKALKYSLPCPQKGGKKGGGAKILDLAARRLMTDSKSGAVGHGCCFFGRAVGPCNETKRPARPQV